MLSNLTHKQPIQSHQDAAAAALKADIGGQTLPLTPQKTRLLATKARTDTATCYLREALLHNRGNGNNGITVAVFKASACASKQKHKNKLSSFFQK